MTQSQVCQAFFSTDQVSADEVFDEFDYFRQVHDFGEWHFSIAYRTFEQVVGVAATLDELWVYSTKVEEANMLAKESPDGCLDNFFDCDIVGLLEQSYRQICFLVFKKQWSVGSIENCPSHPDVLCKVAVVVEVEGLPYEEEVILEAV